MLFDNLEKRDQIIKALNHEYFIPDEFKECVKECIREQQNSNLTEEKIDEMVNKTQSLREKVKNISFYKGKMRLEQFQGYVAEWLICMEYNALKNKGNVVLTIINPDDTSKADLLHIIKTKDGYKCVPGPDVKASKNRDYIFKQWEKNLKDKRDIPMVDFYGIITTEKSRKENLSKAQLKRFNELKKLYPNKKTVSTKLSSLDLLRVSLDYIKFLESNHIPSNYKGNFKVENLNCVEYIDSIKKKAENLNSDKISWNEYKFKSDEVQKKVVEKQKIESLEKKNNEKKDNIERNLIDNKKNIKTNSNECKNSSDLFNKLKNKALVFAGKKIEYFLEHPEQVIDKLYKIGKGAIVLKKVNDFVKSTNNDQTTDYYKEFMYNEEIIEDKENIDVSLVQIKEELNNDNKYEVEEFDDREKNVSVKKHMREYKPGKFTEVSAYKKRKPKRKEK